MTKAKQQSQKQAKNNTIRITLGQLVDSQNALAEFLSMPKPLLYAMDFSIALKKQIQPQVEAYFEQLRVKARHLGVELKDTMLPTDFPSDEAAIEFFNELTELQRKEIELNLKTITFREIRDYIAKSRIDESRILVGDVFTRLDWLIIAE